MLVFVLWFGAMSAWSLATPVWASPDEFAHAFRAYSAIHGQVYVAPVRAFHGTGGFVTVPSGWLDSVDHYRCVFRRDADASCLPPLTNDSHSVRVASAAARYNPLYYMAVGSASLLSGPAHAFRLMRLVSAALSALFLSWAFTAAWTARRPRLVASTVLLAATPMVLFLSGAINPNGLEITAAICCWTCGGLAFTARNPVVFRALFRRAAIALIVVVELRALSPLWAAIIIAVLLVAAGRRRHVLAGHRREVMRWGVTIVVAMALAGAWSQFAKSGELQHHIVRKLTFTESLKQAWDGGLNQVRWLTGTVGNFGWLNTPLATGVVHAWLYATAGLLLLALIAGTIHERFALLGLGAVVVALPTFVAAAEWNRFGGFWQGRYTMPISLGIVLLAGISLARSERRVPGEPLVSVLAGTLAALAVAVDLIGFVVALSRYSVGAGRAISIAGHWQPPLGGPVVTVIEAVCLCSLAWLAMRSPASSASAPSETPRATVAAAAPAVQPWRPALKISDADDRITRV